jgi:hypothetical protein
MTGQGLAVCREAAFQAVGQDEELIEQLEARAGLHGQAGLIFRMLG